MKSRSRWLRLRLSAYLHVFDLVLIDGLGSIDSVSCLPTLHLPNLCNSHTRRVQLGTNAFDGAHHDEAADHFTTTVNSSVFSSKFIPRIYKDSTVVRQDDVHTMLAITESLVKLFGRVLNSLNLTAYQRQRCQPQPR
jgi:hypothetical protein